MHDGQKVEPNEALAVFSDLVRQDQDKEESQAAKASLASLRAARLSAAIDEPAKIM